MSEERSGKGDPLHKEWLRVADICNGCRRCFHLCPSFDTLFELLDSPSVDGDSARLSPDALDLTQEGCNLCKLCYNHCPYCPPHSYALDFPNLMVRSRIRSVRKKGLSVLDRMLSRTDRTGRMGTRFASLLNRTLESPFLRKAGQKFLEVHSEAPILPFSSETFMDRYGKGRPVKGRGTEEGRSDRKVALFVTCLGNYQLPEVPDSVLRILEHHGIPVLVPGSVCCGMPFLDVGDLDGFREQASRVLALFLPLVREGYQVVAPIPTCSLTLRKEYLQYGGGGEADDREFRELSDATMDFFHFLQKLRLDGQLRTDFKNPAGRISYHVPCHLRDQNIGAPVKEILGLVPGTTVVPVEQCSGHGGSWGMRESHFPDAVKRAGRTSDLMMAAGDGTWSSDCPLAARAIGAQGDRKVEHPAVLLRKAYGL
ncbi:MAG: heterodisulfide reductase-related iron-sulfur binding cluster [Leptospirales bacterium]